MNLFALLLAKTGTATLTTKIAVVGVMSVAAVGTAGATGVVPVASLLPGDTTAVVEEDGSTEVPVEHVTDPEAAVSDEVEVTDPALEDVAPEDAGKSATEALEAAQSRAPEQADAGLDRAREAVARAAERRAGAGTDTDADADADDSEQTARPAGEPQRPVQGTERVAPRAERATGQAREARSGDDADDTADADAEAGSSAGRD